MNTVFLIGRLVADPDLRYIPATGNAVASFNLAVDRQYSKDKEKKTDFFKITVFSRFAKNCANYLAKGRLAAVKGSVQNNNYTGKDGNTIYGTVIVADQVQFLEKGEAKAIPNAPEGFSPKGLENAQYIELEDDSPF